MMLIIKAILEFDLKEEDSLFKYALQGSELKSCLDEVWQEYRRLTKYSDLSEFKTPNDLLEHLKEHYIESLKGNDLQFD